jgi:hypothetical protein
MSVHDYRRRKVSPSSYQCGCRWERRPGWGDVMVECEIHRQATRAAVRRFERKHGKGEGG